MCLWLAIPLPDSFFLDCADFKCFEPICMQTSLPTFHNKNPVVVRRYNDFVALRERLRSEVNSEAVRVIPYLPYSWYSVVVPSSTSTIKALF